MSKLIDRETAGTLLAGKNRLDGVRVTTDEERADVIRRSDAIDRALAAAGWPVCLACEEALAEDGDDMCLDCRDSAVEQRAADAVWALVRLDPEGELEALLESLSRGLTDARKVLEDVAGVRARHAEAEAEKTLP